MTSKIGRFATPRLVLAAAAGILLSAALTYGSASAAGTWTQQFTGDEIIKFAWTDTNHLWGSTSYGHVLYTTNGGQNWTSVDVASVWGGVAHGVSFADNLNGWTVGEQHGGGFIYHTTDGGHTWTQQTDPSAQRLFGVAALDPQTVMIVGGGTYKAVTRRSTDGGNTWTDMPVMLNDSMFLDIYCRDKVTCWVTGLDGGMAKTTDGGVTWTNQPVPYNWGLNSTSFADANNGWSGGYYGMLFHTADGGNTWTQQDPVLPEYTHILSVSAVSPTTAWISGYGGGPASRPFVKRTSDGGATWEDLTPAVGPYDSFAAVHFLDAENGWAGGHAGIFRRGGTTTMPPSATATSTTGTTQPLPSNTPVPPTATSTNTTQPPASTATATATTGTRPNASATATVRASATPTTSPGGAPAACDIQFTDVAEGSTFYNFVRCLSCRNVLGGYSDGTFRPNVNITRGQLSKVVSNAAGFGDTPTKQTFEDVTPANPFYVYIERMVAHKAISGYTCGGTNEPCVAPTNRSYFRPNSNATRGQISKIVSNAAGYSEPATTQLYQDVLPGSPFFETVDRLSMHGAIGGYGCGQAGLPCGSSALPYFKPNDNATRGQVAKIVSNAFFPNCQTTTGPR